MLLFRSFNRFILIGIALLSLYVPPANAATLNIAGGQLTGADGVDVNGTLYNVDFIDGTCVAIFGGCDATSDFTFTTSSDAVAAASALLEQVFLGGYDEFPEATAGCTDAIVCRVHTPYDLISDIVLTLRADNFSPASGNPDLTAGDGFLSASDLSGNTNSVYARWSPAAVNPVPVPAAVWLFSTALIGLVGFCKRRKVA